MTPARPRWTTSEVERLARRLRAIWWGMPGLYPGACDDWNKVAAHVLKNYVPRKRPAKTGKGKR